MSDFWRGVRAATVAMAVLALALLPSRVSVAMRVRGGSLFERVTRALAGALLDLSQVFWLVALWVGVLLVLGLAWRLSRGVVTRVGPAVLVAPWAAVLLVVTVTEQEVKAERGAFSTLTEMLDAAGEASFVEGASGFLAFTRILVPTVAMLLALGVLLWRTRGGARWHHDAVHPVQWGRGALVALLAVSLAAPVLARAQGLLSERLSPAGLGNPLENLVETSLDWARGTPPARPMDLLNAVAPTPQEVALGATRLGWPPPPVGDDAGCLSFQRTADEPPSPAGPLLEALQQVSTRLWEQPGPNVALFLLSLESFRGADLHALNPSAPTSLAPFTNALFERNAPGVLVSRHTWQAGVRTAQGLAAITCGLGTLPYNLSLIRDLPELPLRCAPDVLVESGFEGSFFYGSDPGYDQMDRFLRSRGITRVVAEQAFAAEAPRGAWGGVTDFVLFDRVVAEVASALPSKPQLALVMSLSNHSPYTPPADLPEAVSARAKASLTVVPSRATSDDVKRLTTWSYTDAALERFFAALEAQGLAERSIVVFIADHSTGEDYVWGADDFEHETDAAKAQVPFAMVIPEAFLTRVGRTPELLRALEGVQRELDRQVLSQNDVPALLLALTQAHPGRKASAPWHTLGGQRTSASFQTGTPRGALLGINGVDESYVLDANEVREGAYEDAVFLRTKADRARVTPRLRPAAATLLELARRRCD
jgi:hypothetical protein